MDKSEMEKSPFSNIDQVGVMVRDMDKAIEYFQSLGIGPFESLNLTVTDRIVYGKPANDVRNMARVAKMGSVQFELLQPVSGESVQKEYLDKHGEGINHLAFFVDDIDKEIARLEEKGFESISSGKFTEGGGFAYINTDKVGGIMFELIQWPPG